MTIDLGFAWLTLPSGAVASIVDVPGHESFIKNMLAGVGGIDAALFVVAADEGIMPQSREHLDILDLLELEYGVVAITKIDQVEDEGWLELVIEEVTALLQDTALSEAQIVPVSALTGQGSSRICATRRAAPRAMPAPAQLPPVWRMGWYMTKPRRMIANPTANGPRSRMERPTRYS